MDYLIFKSLHIGFVIAWFAGLFYLPRIFVNLAMVDLNQESEYSRLILMANKLFKFMTPLGVLAVGLGIFIWIKYGFSGGWLHLKTTLVFLLMLYHFYCGRILSNFKNKTEIRGHKWFRFFNEGPVLIMFICVFLAVLKPF